MTEQEGSKQNMCHWLKHVDIKCDGQTDKEEVILLCHPPHMARQVKMLQTRPRNPYY